MAFSTKRAKEIAQEGGKNLRRCNAMKMDQQRRSDPSAVVDPLKTTLINWF
jgi:hypothetical protein